MSKNIRSKIQNLKGLIKLY